MSSPLRLTLLIPFACAPPFEATAPLSGPGGDPVPAFDAWAQTPPPPLAACAPGVQALLGGLAWTSSADAAAAATAGSTLWLCPGVHTQSLAFTTTGPFAVAGITGDPADVVIDGGAFAGRAISPPRASTFQVRFVTMTGFDVDDNSVLEPGTGAKVDLLGVDFVDNLETLGIQGHLYFFRARQIQVRHSLGQFLDLASTTPHSTGDPSVILQDILVRHHQGSKVIHLDSHSMSPLAEGTSVLLRDIVIEDGEFSRTPIDLSGPFIEAEVDGLVMRRNTVRVSPTGAPGPLLMSSTHPSTLPRKVRLLLRDAVFEDNDVNEVIHGSWGSATTIDDVRMALIGGGFRRNTATRAVVGVGVDLGIVVQGVDFGVGVDDNLSPVEFAGPCELTALGAGTTFRQMYWHGWESPDFRCP